jgi:glycosyltransferase involved in cell wall biosynthesis
VAPTQKHRWLGLGDTGQHTRIAALRAFAVDTALADFDARYPGVRFGPVVALVAAFEEEQNIGAVLKAMPTLVGDLEVSTLVMVDGGTDDTVGVARKAGVFTCEFPVNLGHGAALRTGYKLAAAHGARYVVTLDADGQNDPAEIPQVLAPLLADQADFVVASRRLGIDKTTDRFRKTGVFFFSFIMNRMTGAKLTDTSTGYRALRVTMLADVIDRLRQEQYQTSELLITCLKRGWRSAEVPTVWHPRFSGTTKKGKNWLFGFRYARVVFGTWWRER